MNDFKLTLEASLLSSWRKNVSLWRINPLVRGPRGGSRRHKQLRPPQARGTSGPARAGSRAPPAPSAGPRGLQGRPRPLGLGAAAGLLLGPGLRWTAEPAAARVALGPTAPLLPFGAQASLLPARDLQQGTRLSHRACPQRASLHPTVSLLASAVRIKGRTLGPGPEGKGVHLPLPFFPFKQSSVRSSARDAICQPRNTC